MKTSRRRTVPTRKETTHARIVDAASRAIRRSGYDGTGVADIMKDAGLTHGGFYAHFDSREAMLAEAADQAGADTVARMTQVAGAVPPRQALHAMLRAYLSKEHVEGVETGCAVAALGSEMPRQAPQVRRAATRRIKEMVDLVARQMPDWGQPARDHGDGGGRADGGARGGRPEVLRRPALRRTPPPHGRITPMALRGPRAYP
jgi:TetR/AcrR family transcriptional repressor of nem operon